VSPVLGYYRRSPWERSSRFIMKKLLIPILTVASLGLSACGDYKLPGVYRIDIQQGNIITQEMVDKLRPGMTKRQVRLSLGTPVLVDPFHQDRWDYLYTNQSGGEEREQHRVTLFFENDRLTQIAGDMRPRAADEITEEDTNANQSVVVPEGALKEKGLFQKLKDLIGLGDD